MPFQRTTVADVLRRAKSVADWDLVENLYRQCAEIASDPECRYLPDEMPGQLAEALSRTSASYHGQEAELAAHALAVFAEVDGREQFHEKLFQRSYEDGRFRGLPTYAETGQGRRRRPTPYEAIIETCRRLRDTNSVREALIGSGTSGVLGGSTSYGRFYNVRGNAGSTASDLDIVVVTDSADQLKDIEERLQHVSGVSKTSLESMAERSNIFRDRYDDSQTVLSHKLGMWADGQFDPLLAWTETPPSYMLSLHIMARSVLDYVLVEACTKLVRDAAGTKRTVRDYRNTSPTRDDHNRTFGGRNHHMGSVVEPAEHGYLRRSRVYLIDDTDSYCPGLFQNLVLPRLEVRWDENEVGSRLARFKWKMQERLLYERQMRPHAYLRLSFSHIRREVFAPHVIRAVDNTDTLA